MAEYAGYVSRKEDALDWSKIASGLSKGIDDITKAKEERKQQAYEATQGAIKDIDATEIPKTQTLNDFTLTTLGDAREKTYEAYQRYQNKEMTLSDYKRVIQNIQESIGSFSGAVKTYDDRIQEAIARQQPGEKGEKPIASTYEMNRNGKAMNLKDLSNKKMIVQPDGRMLFVEQNPDGTYNMGSAVDAKSLTKLENTIDNRVDVSGTVDDLVKGVGGWQTFEKLYNGATKVTDDPRLNEAYNGFKADAAGVLVRRENPRGIVSVLLDNSDSKYRLYETQSDIDKIVIDELDRQKRIKGSDLTQEEIDKYTEESRKYLIQIKRDANGIDQPVITEEMINEANEVVYNYIESKIGHKETGTGGYKPATNGGGGNTHQDGGGDYARYATLIQGWKTGDINLLNSGALPGYKFEFAGEKGDKKINVLQLKGTDTNGEAIWTPVHTAQYTGGSGRALASYMFKSTTKDGVFYSPEQMYDWEKQAYNASKGSGSQNNNSNNTSDPLGLGI